MPIIDVTEDQKCHRLRKHNVDLKRYDRQAEGMDLLQAEIEARTSIIKLS